MCMYFIHYVYIPRLIECSFFGSSQATCPCMQPKIYEKEYFPCSSDTFFNNNAFFVYSVLNVRTEHMWSHILAWYYAHSVLSANHR